jgi:hypothetical protein
LVAKLNHQGLSLSVIELDQHLHYNIIMQFPVAEHFTQAPILAYDLTFTIINPLVF